MWTAAAMSPRSQLLVQPVLRVHARRARCGSSPCAPRSIRSSRGTTRLRVVIAPDGASQTIRAAVLPSSCRSSTCRTLDPEARQREIEAACCNRSARRRSTSPRARWSARSSCASRQSATVFVLTAHHIVCDGWSSAVLFSELGSALRGRLRRYPGAARAGRVVRGVRRGADEPRPGRGGRSRRGVLGRAVSRRSAGPRPPAHRSRAPPRRRTAAAASTCGSTRSCTPRSSRPGRDREPRSSRCWSPPTRCSSTASPASRTSSSGIPFAGQPQLENSALVAHCVSTVPLRATPRPGDARSPSTFALSVATTSPKPRTTRDMTFGSLVRRLQLPRDRESHAPRGDHVQHRQDRRAVRLRRRHHRLASPRRSRTPTSSCR